MLNVGKTVVMSDRQPNFWVDLLETVHDIPNPGEYISFEERVMYGLYQLY